MPLALRVLITGIALFALVWGVASLWWPYFGDHAWIGWVADVIRAGGRPYVDAWDNNGPGVYLQQALLQAAFGSARWPIRALDLVYLGITGWAMIALGQRLHSRWAGYWAFAAFVCVYAEGGNRNTAQRDGYGAMLATWALALAGGRLVHTALAGLLLGFATLIKPHLALMLLPVWVLSLESKATEGRRTWRVSWPNAAVLLVCFLVPIAAVVLWLAPAGGLRDTYECLVLYNTRVYVPSDSRGIFHLVGRFVAHVVGMPLTVLTAAGMAYLHAHRKLGRWAVGAAWPVAACAVVLGGTKLYRYHWHVLLAPMSLLGGVGVAAITDIWQAAQPKSKAVLGTVLLIILITLFAWPCRFMAITARWWVVRMQTHQEIPPSLGPYAAPTANVQLMENVADYIKSRIPPGEPVQVWDSQPGIYFLAERKCATRFGWNAPLVRSFANALPDLHQRYVQEFLHDLEAVHPKYFIVAAKELPSLREVPEINSYVQKHYAQEAVVGQFLVLRRN